jgi:predicted outer membrane lipoprotein
VFTACRSAQVIIRLQLAADHHSTEQQFLLPPDLRSATSNLILEPGARRGAMVSTRRARPASRPCCLAFVLLLAAASQCAGAALGGNHISTRCCGVNLPPSPDQTQPSHAPRHAHAIGRGIGRRSGLCRVLLATAHGTLPALTLQHTSSRPSPRLADWTHQTRHSLCCSR